jgi:protein phosphatase
MAVEIFEREVGRGIELGVTKSAELPAASGTPGTHPVAHTLRQALGEATRSIWEEAQSHSERAGMGTTLTGLCFHGERVTVAHVGDSRAYLYRNGQARQLTEDHSWIAEQVRAGLLAADDILATRFRNIITRSVGFEPTVEPDLLTFGVEAGDCYLLCSDGLSNYLSAQEIGEALTQRFYADAPKVLIDLANERGGDDNVTVVVVYVANA